MLIAYVISSVAGLMLLKMADGLATLTFLLGLGLYGFGFFIWIVLLKLFPLSFAFPVAAGSLMIGTQIAGLIFLKESLSLPHLIGVAMILLGLCVISIFSRGIMG